MGYKMGTFFVTNFLPLSRNKTATAKTNGFLPENYSVKKVFAIEWCKIIESRKIFRMVNFSNFDLFLLN
jgi:hypothetical protein